MSELKKKKKKKKGDERVTGVRERGIDKVRTNKISFFFFFFYNTTTMQFYL